MRTECKTIYHAKTQYTLLPDYLPNNSGAMVRAFHYKGRLQQLAIWLSRCDVASKKEKRE